MLEQKDLILLRKDDKVDHYLLVKKCELRNSKNNKPYFFLTLGDKNYSLNANLWDNFDYLSSIIKSGDIIKVKGVIDEYLGAFQIKVKDIRPAAAGDNVSVNDFLARSSRDPLEMKNEFFTRIKKIRDTRLKILLKRIFNEDNFRKFSHVPAGKSWHHSYIHGLLEHTLEIVKICDLISDFHSEINRDLLISGAMLHDFGKIEELSYDTHFEYTDKGKLLGHIVIATMIINEEASRINGFPEELKNCLLHLILSHQGKLEFASPVVPKTLEAITLYHADELSAKVNAYKNAIQSEAKSDNKWTKYISLVSTDLYNHGISFEPPAEEKSFPERVFSPEEQEIQTTLFEEGK
jgi:3'-5' exoribonuclease